MIKILIIKFLFVVIKSNLDNINLKKNSNNSKENISIKKYENNQFKDLNNINNENTITCYLFFRLYICAFLNSKIYI